MRVGPSALSGHSTDHRSRTGGVVVPRPIRSVRIRGRMPGASEPPAQTRTWHKDITWSRWLGQADYPAVPTEEVLRQTLPLITRMGAAGRLLAAALKDDFATRRRIRARMAACTTG